MTDLTSNGNRNAALEKMKSFSKTFDIFVGPERDHFAVHVAILKKNSGYFRRMLNSTAGVWIEQATGRLELPDIDPKGFYCLISLLYDPSSTETTNLAVKSVDREGLLTTEEEGTLTDWTVFARIYAMADRFQFDDAKTSILKELDIFRHTLKVHGPQIAELQEFYEQGVDYPQLRHKMFDVWSSESPEFREQQLDQLSDAPHAFLEDYVRHTMDHTACLPSCNSTMPLVPHRCEDKNCVYNATFRLDSISIALICLTYHQHGIEPPCGFTERQRRHTPQNWGDSGWS